MKTIVTVLPFLSLLVTVVGTFETWLPDNRAPAFQLLTFGIVVSCLAGLIAVIVLKADPE